MAVQLEGWGLNILTGTTLCGGEGDGGGGGVAVAVVAAAAAVGWALARLPLPSRSLSAPSPLTPPHTPRPGAPFLPPGALTRTPLMKKYSPGASAVPANSEPHMTVLAPKSFFIN